MHSLTPQQVRALGLVALVGGVVGALYWPLHAPAYFATGDGAASTEEAPWVAAFNSTMHETFPALYGWGDPDTVYTTYGKIVLLPTLGFLAGTIALHARQRERGGRLETWGFRVLAVGFGLTTLGAFTEYFTPYLDEGFMFLSVPGILLTLGGTVAYGIATIRIGVAPRVGAWLLALGGLPGIPLMTILVGHLSAGLLVLDAAFITLGYWLWKTS